MYNDLAVFVDVKSTFTPYRRAIENGEPGKDNEDVGPIVHDIGPEELYTVCIRD